jgi:hypothetical protein
MSTPAPVPSRFGGHTLPNLLFIEQPRYQEDRFWFSASQTAPVITASRGSFKDQR